MVNTCCVPGCKSGYRSVHTTPVKPTLYQFPKDDELRRKWIRAIPRKDWVPTNSSHVCAQHFHDDDFKITSTDSRSSRRNARKSETLQRPRLKPGAFPKVFPNLPSYLSSNAPLCRSANTTSSARIKRRNAAIESMNEDFLGHQDMIENLDMLKEKLKHEILPTGFVLIVNEETVQFHYFNSNSNITEIVTPKLLASTIITSNLKLHSFVHESPVPCNTFKDFAPTGYVTSISALLNILALQKSMLPGIGNASSELFSLKMALLYLQQYVEQQQIGEDCDSGKVQLISFIIEQLQLCQVGKHARRYSINTMKTAFLWQLLSNALYKQLKSLFVLPSLRWLQNLSAGASVTSGDCHLEYLKVRSRTLSDKEKMVTLMIDEVYIAERVEYSHGSFIGISENGTPAKTVLGFMIQSIYCNYKDIVCLIPISRLDTGLLHSWFSKVMVALGDLFHVIAISTDNHICNRKLFHDLCGGELQPSIPHPIRSHDRLFLIFDFTHNFKNIFNNFIGKGRFHLPAVDFPDLLGQTCIAQFEHIKRLYALEEHKTLKIAFSLKKVSLNPSSLARTSPQHALCVFSESTARGLRFYSEQYPGFCQTAVFVEFISNLWKVMSLKTPSKGIRKNDQYCEPLNVLERSSMHFLMEAKNVFMKWKDSGNAGLTKETFLACIQSMGAIINLTSYLHNQHDFRYTLPGKFMSDPIEGRFGWYRQANGGNFYMSVRQLMLAEKKIRMLSLLQQKMLVETSKFSFESIALELSTTNNTADVEWLHAFLLRNQVGDLNELSLVDANVTYFVSGYIGRSICRRRKCAECKVLLLAEKENEVRIEEHLPQEFMDLFDDANRGGLSAPTELCYAITALAVQSYTTVSSDKEIKMRLLTAGDQRAIFTQALLRLASTSIADLRQHCSRKHENFELIAMTAFNCFAKNELKRLNCKNAEPPAKMQRTVRKLKSNVSAKHT